MEQDQIPLADSTSARRVRRQLRRPTARVAIAGLTGARIAAKWAWGWTVGPDARVLVAVLTFIGISSVARMPPKDDPRNEELPKPAGYTQELSQDEVTALIDYRWKRDIANHTFSGVDN